MKEQRGRYVTARHLREGLKRNRMDMTMYDQPLEILVKKTHRWTITLKEHMAILLEESTVV